MIDRPIHSTDHKILVSLVVRLWTVVITENILGRYREAKYHGETYSENRFFVRFADIMVTQRHA